MGAKCHLEDQSHASLERSSATRQLVKDPGGASASSASDFPPSSLSSRNARNALLILPCIIVSPVYCVKLGQMFPSIIMECERASPESSDKSMNLLPSVLLSSTLQYHQVKHAAL